MHSHPSSDKSPSHWCYYSGTAPHTTNYPATKTSPAHASSHQRTSPWTPRPAKSPRHIPVSIRSITHKYHTGSLSINTVAFGLIVQPLPLVNVTVIVYQPAHAIGFIVSPVALVYRTNAPDLFASSILFIIFPLPLVDVLSIDKGCGFRKENQGFRIQPLSTRIPQGPQFFSSHRIEKVRQFPNGLTLRLINNLTFL